MISFLIAAQRQSVRAKTWVSMFITLLGVTFLIATAVSALVTYIFAKPIANILGRIVADRISSAWVRYLYFAIFVVGISSGVRIYSLEQYVTPRPNDKQLQVVELTHDRWILEIYRTIIETLQGIAWLLLVFFVFALIAYVIVRAFEAKREGAGARHEP